MKKIVYLIVALLFINNAFSQISSNPHTFDNHGNNVGIFTHHPQEALEVADGNVQISRGQLIVGNNYQTVSGFKLKINGGNASIRSSYPGLTLNLAEPGQWPRFANFGVAGHNGDYSPFAIKGDLVLRLGGNDHNKFILTNSGGGDIVFATDSWNDNSIKMSIKPSGNVGIGTRNPDESLTVKGKIHCEEVKVDLNIPADYVFQKYFTGYSPLKPEYNLPNIEEVESYIEKHHHLQDIPSAKQMKEEGMQLKMMTNLLLQKVEELTVYTIELNKEIKELKKKLKGRETQLKNKTQQINKNEKK